MVGTGGLDTRSHSMDTLSMFEQFRASLGEEKTKEFAQTLGR